MTFCEGSDCVSVDQYCSEDAEAIEVPEEVAKLFRIFELEILVGTSSVYHRVLISNVIESILDLEHEGLRYLVLHLYESIQTRAMDKDVLEAWHITISFFAEKLEADDAPEQSDSLSDWFAWAADFTGIEFVEEEEEDESLAE
jgi:hypothetical protein